MNPNRTEETSHAESCAIKIIQNRHFPDRHAGQERASRSLLRSNSDVDAGGAADDGKLLGICTERDLTFKVLAAAWRRAARRSAR